MKIVCALCSQTVKPSEIVIVDSSLSTATFLNEISALCAVSNIKLIYEHRERAMPGDARNIGLRIASGELIAFVDVQTIPRANWLKASIELMVTHESLGVWGSTCFSADTKFERLVRDGFYGVLPRKTLPGSVFRRVVFDKVGQFIDWVRAGEDTEWMLRLQVLKIPIVNSSSGLVDYLGLIDSNMMQLLKKRYRNYTASRELPHLFPQILLMWLVLYPLLVLVAFNWNYLIADWRMDSPLYIVHITKLVAILPAVIYVVVRGLVLPLQRGVGIWQLLPARLLGIIAVCFMADFVKILVFSLPRSKVDPGIPPI